MIIMPRKANEARLTDIALIIFRRCRYLSRRLVASLSSSEVIGTSGCRIAPQQCWQNLVPAGFPLWHTGHRTQRSLSDTDSIDILRLYREGLSNTQVTLGVTGLSYQ